MPHGVPGITPRKLPPLLDECLAGHAFRAVTRILDGPGVQADAAFRDFPAELIESLSVGRPIAETPGASAVQLSVGGFCWLGGTMPKRFMRR